MTSSLSRGVILSLAAVVAMISGPLATAQVMVTRNPVKDNTLYEDVQGDVSNGAGPDIIAGLTNGSDSLRRAVLKFDLSTIPPGSTVTAATLTMHLNRAQVGSFSVALHKLNADWGEGTSNAGGGGANGGSGGGAPAATNDATWLFKFYPGMPWTNPGGDFVPAASATTTVGIAIQNYTWSSAQLRTDVTSWINTPANNFGWLVKGNEVTNQSTRRFDSRQATTVANRPLLSITYTPPNSPTGACCVTSSGSCSELTQFDCGLQAGTTYQGNNTVCTPNPCPQPTGACCLPGQVCSTLTSAACTTQSGDYQGNGISCTPNPCIPSTNVTLAATQDNTLYESATGALSNGAGQLIFAGNNAGDVRRAVILFNFSSIPSNATITNVRLRLTLRFSPGLFAPSQTFTLLRLTNSWGEGASDAAGNETAGAPAAHGDATWIHRFAAGTLWNNPGGDYNTHSLGTSNSVGNVVGSIEEWTGPVMVSDVQGWLRNAATNFGWILGGAEGVNNSHRGFDSRTGTRAPQLIVTYQVGPATGACCAIDGDCTIATNVACVAAGNIYSGDNTDCSPNPCPQPTGACCLNSGNCVSVTSASCTTQSGAYQGDFVTCGSVSCPIILVPFVDALPIPPVAVPASGVPGGAAHYDISIVEFAQKFHRDLPNSVVWGYNGFYPGPTIEAHRDQPVTVTWINNLRDLTTNQLRTTHYLPVDTCPHGPDVTGSVPRTVTHLHGAHLKPDSDGDPDSNFPPGAMSPLYSYPNIQQAATMWYHDHCLGLTRLNVYMGLAGFYFIRDAAEDGLNIPRGANEIPLVIQDRSFNPNGTLKYVPTWQDHFFGDFVTVNGKVAPFLNVLRGKYRFRLVNGSDNRFYTLSLSNGATFQQIGSDLGLLSAPVTISSLTIAPGERADIVIDFQPYVIGTEIILTNSAPAPFPSGAPESAIPNVMKFVVIGGGVPDTDPLPVSLVPVVPLNPASAVVTRSLQLRRSSTITCPMHATGPWMINDLMWDDITETPRIGTTEIWSWINRSGDAHPMHIHLVAAQVLDRQDFVMNGNIVVPTGPVVPPAPNEAGWKDTVKATPNQITRVIVKFDDFPGIFPYHCHILEHEDHEMMRQFNLLCDSPVVVAPPPPPSVQSCRGGSFSFSVAAVGDVLQYQWRRGATNLVNGASPTGSTIFGALSPTLSISNAQAGDAGNYTCLVTNPCGMQTSATVHVIICLPDINCSGGISVQDIFDFLALYFAGNLRADFNNSGVVSVQDIFDFLAAYFAGCS